MPGIVMEYEFVPPAMILAAEFVSLGLDIRSFKEPLKESIQKVMAPSIRANFDVSGRPVRWEPLADVTIEQKFQQGARRPSAPVIRTGTLQRVAGQLNIWKIDGPAGEASITDLKEADYGGWQNNGTTTIPARPFLVFQKEDESRIDEIFIHWLQIRMAAHGFTPGVTGVLI
jgi:phage gpG-like protein